MLITDFFGSVRETVLFEDIQPETVLSEEILPETVFEENQPETTSFEGSSDNNTHNIESAFLRDSIQLKLVSQLPF